jgi:hypothetical protein
MTYTFSGPSILGFYPPVTAFGAVVIGGLYHAFTDTADSSNQKKGLVVVILMVRETIDFLFYQIGCVFSRASSSRKKAQVYAGTNLTVNIMTLFALRRLELIGNVGTAVFATLIAIEMACKWFDFSKYQASTT